MEDLDAAELHHRVELEFAEQARLDCVGDGGLKAVGLPASYPFHPDSRPVEHPDCQPIGQAMFDDGLPGVACRSAPRGATTAAEELAMFARTGGPEVTMTGRRPFADWFWA